MSKFILSILGILVFTSLVTYLTASVTFKKPSFTSISYSSYDTVVGFPFYSVLQSPSDSQLLELDINQERNQVILKNMAFWFLAFSALYFSLHIMFKKRSLVSSLLLLAIISWLLFEASYSFSTACLSGYPIPLRVRCIGVAVPNYTTSIYEFLNFSYYLSIAFIFYATHELLSQRLFKFRYLYYPLFATLLSLSIEQSCDSFFCLTPTGRGFPIAYLNRNAVDFVLLMIDMTFWFIILALAIFSFDVLRRLRTRKLSK